MIIPSANEIYTVSQLNKETHIFLEETFGTIWIMGEISNLTRPSSGHLYFSLKDNKAQIRCAFFRNSRRRLQFTPQDGQHVIIRAVVSLYEPRGDYQLIVSQMEIAGSGALQIAFEKLKNKLAAEGLFDEQHKKIIPFLPKRIGIVTSPTGAAIHDILTVLKRRFSSIPIIIYPSLVQGEQAAKQIAHAIKLANNRNECDVLLLARGGGSLEDLWPFNEEIVARAIYASQIPIVTGIGHEVDFTIADFVADQRAATPSAAAEQVSPTKSTLNQQINQLCRHLTYQIQSRLKQIDVHLNHLCKRLRHPGQRLREQMQHLDRIEQNLLMLLKHQLSTKNSTTRSLFLKLISVNPKNQIGRHHSYLTNRLQQLEFVIQQKISYYEQRINQLAATLDATSPLKTLERGYAILSTKETKQLIRRASDTKIDDSITAQLLDGKLECIVKDIKFLK